jgi:hypothetical protein
VNVLAILFLSAMETAMNAPTRQLAYSGQRNAERAHIYRGRAHHARLGAKETSRGDFRAIFERLAASYEELANEAERLQAAEEREGSNLPA